MTYCWAIVRILLAVQYRTNPEGKGASITVKKTGKNIKIPIIIGSGPIIKNSGGEKVNNPNKFIKLKGYFSERSTKYQ